MKKVPLHVQIIIGLVLGVAYAFVSSWLGWNDFTITWIDPFGTIFIRLLKLIAVPLVLFSIIGGIAGLSDVTKLGRLGLKTIVLYMTTTVIAVGFGLLLVNTLKPGKQIDDAQRLKNRISYELWATGAGIDIKDGRSFATDPANASLVAEMQQDSTLIAQAQKAARQLETAEKRQEQSPLQFLVDIVPENVAMSIADNSLMLQVIFFAVFFGICVVLIPNEKGKPVIDFIQSINEVFLKMVELIMRVAPYFVFALLAGVIAKMANTPAEVLEIFKGLGSYTLTLLGGLLFMIFIFYPLVIAVFVKGISYRQFLKNISPAQFLAFSTSSSAATLPVTMECMEENMGVSKNVTSFVLPIGATVNMDGTSMLQGVAVVFMAQLHMIDLSLVQQLTIVFTATLASIGAAAVPSAGLVMMIIVLQSVGLNPAWVAIIFPVDRILDMFRTVVNVTGDMTVSTMIAQSEGEIDLEVANRKE